MSTDQKCYKCQAVLSGQEIACYEGRCEDCYAGGTGLKDVDVFSSPHSSPWFPRTDDREHRKLKHDNES
jgi:hypothetical protein